MSETQRNFLILAAIAVVVAVAGTAGSVATSSVGGIINILFLVVGVIAYVQFRRRNSGTIRSMKAVDRLLFEGGIIGIVVVWVTGRMFPAWSIGHGALGSLLFIVAIAACGYAIYLGWSNRPNKYW